MAFDAHSYAESNTLTQQKSDIVVQLREVDGAVVSISSWSTSSIAVRDRDPYAPQGSSSHPCRNSTLYVMVEQVDAASWSSVEWSSRSKSSISDMTGKPSRSREEFQKVYAAWHEPDLSGVLLFKSLNNPLNTVPAEELAWSR